MYTGVLLKMLYGSHFMKIAHDFTYLCGLIDICPPFQVAQRSYAAPDSRMLGHVLQKMPQQA